jgi:GNAT superfamily N-acetyltransferase
MRTSLFLMSLLNCAMIRQAITADIPKLARVHVQSWLETYTGLIPDDVLHNIITIESRELQWQRTLANAKVMVFVAVISSQIVGFSSVSLTDHQAELYTLYLLKTHQGSGLGKQLFQAALEYAKARGAKSLTLWVLADNPTRKFYEYMGGYLEDERIETIGEANLLEVMYEFWL